MSTNTNGSAKLTLAQIWQRLSPLTSEVWAQPIGISIHPDLIRVEIEFQHNDRAAVDGAFNAMAVVNKTPQVNLTFVMNEGKDNELRIYGDRYCYLKSPLLPGISLGLYCCISTNAHPSVHGEGFGLPPKRLCPCGLEWVCGSVLPGRDSELTETGAMRLTTSGGVPQ